MKSTPKAIVVALATITLLAGCTAVSPESNDSDSFTPSGDVEMVVPAGAGGGSDIFGRAVATATDGDPSINVVNREGGSGSVGYSYLLGKSGDPLILSTTENTILTAPLTLDVAFDYTDFTPIAMFAEDYAAIIVRDDSPYENCSDLLEDAANKQILAGISGQTGVDTINVSLLEDEADVSFQRVPYDSGAELITGLLGGSIAFAPLSIGEVSGQVRAGDLRPLCVLAPERLASDDFAEVPTAIEEGYNVAYAQFRGVLAPGGITDEERQYWIDVLTEVAASDAFTNYIETNFLTERLLVGDEFLEFLVSSQEQLEDIL